MLLVSAASAQEAGCRDEAANPLAGVAGAVVALDLATGNAEWNTATDAQGPHEIAVSPDGTTGVAPNYGLAQQGQPPLPGEGTSIAVIDFESGKVRQIPVAPYSRPHGVEF